LVLGAFASIVLAMFLMPPPTPSWSLLTSVPGVPLLIAVVASLGVISLCMSALFFWPRSRLKALDRSLKIVAYALPVLALGWNLLAPVFWLLPVFFVWRAQRGAQH